MSYLSNHIYPIQSYFKILTIYLIMSYLSFGPYCLIFLPFSCSLHCRQILNSKNLVYLLYHVSVLVFISSSFQSFFLLYSLHTNFVLLKLYLPTWFCVSFDLHFLTFSSLFLICSLERNSDLLKSKLSTRSCHHSVLVFVPNLFNPFSWYIHWRQIVIS